MPSGKERILLVEDNRADAVLMEDMLRRSSPSFQLSWVNRLGEAVEKLREGSFDVILLDLTLPDSRGLVTLEKLLAAARSTPIVVVTGVEDEEVGVQAIRQGAQDYLVKGAATGRTVARVIRYAIDRWRAEEALREAQRQTLEAKAAATAAHAARDAIDAMSEGVILLDLAGRIRFVNPALSRLTGYREDDAAGRNIAEFLPPLVAQADWPQTEEALARLRRGVAPGLKPFTLNALDGRRVHVIPAASFIKEPDGRPASIVLTLRDITQLKDAQASLEASEKKYRELVENANSIIMRRTPDGRITFFNEFAQSFFGYSSAEILGRNVVGTIVPPLDSEGRRLDELVLEIGRNPDAYGVNENENTCRDGRRVWIQWTNRALRDDAGNVVEILCVGSDATARKRAEENMLRYQARLRSLATRLATTEEQERLRVARQIHDTVIQSLSLSRIKLGATREALGKAGLHEEQSRLDTVRELLDDGILQSRLLMSDLAPPMLYELGLSAALEDLAARLSRQHGVAIEVGDGVGLPPSLDQALLGMLFQSVRELVVNALKHASASLIRIEIRRADDTLALSVQDNGAGFDPVGLSNHGAGLLGGFGLFSIRERVEGLGGRLRIESQPGRGATFTIAVPLSPPAAG